MATTAAILDVVFRADTSAASRALRTYQASLGRTDKTITSTTRTTGALGKATRSTGTRLRSAAGYAASAAAAYLSIAQAKAAITTTQDLAKTTAGLNRNLGFTVKEGSRWAAVAKSRDIDAKALTMSFTTLSRRVVEAGHAIREGGGAAETAMVPFTRLGLSQQDVLKGSKDLDSFLPRLADSFGEAEGGAKRQASAQQLLGRGYATILPLFADGAKGLQEQQKWADKYGTTLNEKTLKAQMDLVSAQRESKVAWLGIQMAFAQGVTPALEKANDVFQRIAAILADDKLTDAQKWEKIGGIISKWADKALDVFVKVLPQLVERAAEAAPKIAKALVDGIMNSPAIGAFLLGGWLLKGAALPALGRAAGALIGNPMGLAIAATAASAFAGAKLSPKILANEGALIPMNMRDSLDALSESLDITREHAARLVNFMNAHPGLDATESLKIMRDQARHTQNEIKDLRNAWSLSAREIRQKTQQNFKAIRQTMGTESMQAKIAVMNNFDAMVDAIKNSMESGEISAKKGAKMIHDVLIKQLKGYGIKDPEGFLNRQEQASQAHQGGGVSGLASGGLAAMVPGRSTGDKHTLSIDGVPKAKVESGEGVFVGNRKMMGAAATANAMIPRFATGGMVDPAGPGTGVVNPAIADVVGAWSRRYDAAINYGYDPGGGHVSPGHNVTGTATDTSPAGGWAGQALQMFEQGLRSLIGKVPQILYGTAGIGTPWPDHGRGNHAHIEWGMNPNVSGVGGFAGGQVKLPRFSSDFGLGLMVATGLNNTAAGVEKTVNDRLSRMGGGPDTFTGTNYEGPLDRTFGADTVLSSSQIQEVMGSAKLPSIFAEIARAESSWKPGIVSGDGGYGLWQITRGASGMDDVVARMGGYPQMLNPIKNAAITKMMFDDRNTQPWAPSGPWPAVQRGGLLALAEGGSIPELFPLLGSREQDTRKDAQERILHKIGQFGMHPDTLTRLFQGTNALAEHQEYAGYAADRDVTDLNDNLIPGLFRAGTEHSWLVKAREEAWTLRENLIKADTAMRPQIEAFESKDGLIKKAEKRLKQVRDALHDAQVKLKALLEEIERQRDIIEDAKEKLEKKGLSEQQKKHQQDRIDKAQGVIENITGQRVPAVEDAIDRATRERDALVDPVLPALATKFEELRAIKDGIRGDSYSDEATGMGFDGLKTIQGTGSSMDLMPMPDDLEQRFGGTLHDIQMRLLGMIPEPKPGDTEIDQLEAALSLAGLTADLSDDIASQAEIVSYWERELARLQESGGPASEIGSAANSLQSARDALASLQETTGPAGGSDTDSLKLEALMAENQRLRMSAQQAGTFAGFFRQFSAMPQFAGGGVMDRTGPALVHGREGIFTPEQMSALGGRGDVVVNVNLDGMDVVVETFIGGVLAKETRKALSRGPTVGRRAS